MMSSTYPRMRFFGRDKNLAHYLTAWRDSPLTYTLEQANQAGWKRDYYEEQICVDSTGRLFQRAADLLKQYAFYPASVMSHHADFAQANRSAQVNDRVCQRIKVLNLAGLPLLDILTMNEITQIINEPTKQGLGYTSTTAHDEVGHWSAWVEWRDKKQVVLIVESISRSAAHVPIALRPLTRRIQLRAHKLGIQAFKQRIFREYTETAQPTPQQTLGLVGALIATIFLISKWLNRGSA